MNVQVRTVKLQLYITLSCLDDILTKNIVLRRNLLQAKRRLLQKRLQQRLFRRLLRSRLLPRRLRHKMLHQEQQRWDSPSIFPSPINGRSTSRSRSDTIQACPHDRIKSSCSRYAEARMLSRDRDGAAGKRHSRVGEYWSESFV